MHWLQPGWRERLCAQSERLEIEKPRLLEFASQRRDFDRSFRLRGHIRAGREIALRRLVELDPWRGVKVEDNVEAFAAPRVLTVEIDRACRTARGDAAAMVAATLEIDLVTPVDGAFRTGVYAGVATRTQVKIDRIRLRPFHVECAKPSGERRNLPRIHGIVTLRR